MGSEGDPAGPTKSSDIGPRDTASRTRSDPPVSVESVIPATAAMAITLIGGQATLLRNLSAINLSAIKGNSPQRCMRTRVRGGADPRMRPEIIFLLR